MASYKDSIVTCDCHMMYFTTNKKLGNTFSSLYSYVRLQLLWSIESTNDIKNIVTKQANRIFLYFSKYYNCRGLIFIHNYGRLSDYMLVRSGSSNTFSPVQNLIPNRFIKPQMFRDMNIGVQMYRYCKPVCSIRVTKITLKVQNRLS